MKYMYIRIYNDKNIFFQVRFFRFIFKSAEKRPIVIFYSTFFFFIILLQFLGLKIEGKVLFKSIVRGRKKESDTF